MRQFLSHVKKAGGAVAWLLFIYIYWMHILICVT